MKRKGLQSAVKCLLGCLALVSAFYAGTAIGQTPGKAQLATTISADTNASFSPTVKSNVVESITTVFIEKPVKVVEYIEKVKEVPAKIRNFGSLSELEQWLANTGANTSIFYFQPPTGTIDCDDYAITLQQMAIADGYLVSLEVTETNEYNRLFKNSQLLPGTFHAIDSVVIGHETYYIEPQTGEVVFAVHMD